MGLHPGNVRRFANDYELRMTYQCPSPKGLVDLLTAYGPLWYAGLYNYDNIAKHPSDPAGHAVVITGVCDSRNLIWINAPSPKGKGDQYAVDYTPWFNYLRRDSRVPFLHK